MFQAERKIKTPTIVIRLVSCGALLAGCQEHKVTAFNSEPVASITSHTESDQFVEGTAQTFTGMVSDDDDGVGELSTTWRIGEREVCSSWPPSCRN